MKASFLLTCALVLPLFCNGAPGQVVSDSRIFLKNKDAYCLYAENLIENNKFEVASDDCDTLAHGNERQITWLSSTNGRIRTQNGLCLKTYKNFLTVSTCSPDLNDKSEMWKIDSEKRLRNENNTCAQLAGNKLFAFTCNDLSTRDFEIKVFSEDELNFMKAKYAHKKLQNVNEESLQNFHSKSKVLIQSYTEAEGKINKFLNTEKEMIKEKEKIANLMSDIKSLINTSSSLANYGTGALMKIYDNVDISKSNNLLRIPLQSLQVNKEKLNELGIENGQVKIVIQTFLNPPDEGNYTFVAKHVVGKLTVKVDSKEIISNADMRNETTLSSSLVHLSRNKLVPIYIEVSSAGVETNPPMPSFSLLWSSKHIPEQVISSLYLYTTVYEKICYTPFQKKIDCATTFDSVPRENSESHFLCPPGCFAAEGGSYNNASPNRGISNEALLHLKESSPPCYALTSRMCASAVATNLLTQEIGGIIKVTIKQRTNDKGTSEPCAQILPTSMEDNTFKGITDIKVVDMDDFFLNYDANRNLYEGYTGVVTDDKHSLLTRTDLSKRYISDIEINCDKNLRDNYEFSSGSFIVKRMQRSDLTKTEESIVVDAFALFEKYTSADSTPIYLPGWTRKTCNNIQLYIKYTQPNGMMNYPSLLLTCDDTFEQIHFTNERLVVARCLPYCLNSEKPVLGSYIYAPQSAICKSAIHSGIITNKAGGLIQIRKLKNITQSFTNTMIITRNGVIATIAHHNNEDSYYLTKPNGSICNFPRTSHNINVSLNSDSSQDALFSFIQTKSYLMDIPPAVLVHQKHAVLKNQLVNMHNFYNTESYKKALLGSTNEPTGKFQAVQNGDHISHSPGVQENPQLMDSFNTFQRTYEADKGRLNKLAKKQKGIFSNLNLKNKQINNLNKTLSKLRSEQHTCETIIRENQSSLVSLIKQFALITNRKKMIIEKLEKALANVKPITVQTFEEQYNSTNINDNYVIIDGRNISGSSNWAVEKFTNGNLFAAITNDRLIKSVEEIYASYILQRHTKVYKGFISCDVKIPYEGNVGILIKYRDDNNYSNFVINKKEFYFVEMTDGKRSPPIRKRQIRNLPFQLGAWATLFIEFGYKNVRAYINGKYVNGFETKNDSYGHVGIGMNNCKEKIFFDKIVIGSLDQAKYYKGVRKSITIPSTNDMNGFHKVEGKNNLNEKPISEEATNTDNQIKCKPFTERCNLPLDTNWIVPPNTFWRIKNNFALSSIWANHERGEQKHGVYPDGQNQIGKMETDECYLHSAQKRKEEENLLIPSIILLKRHNLCNNMKLFSLKIFINLKPLTKSGVIFRVLSSDDFLSVILDTTQMEGKLYLLKISNGIPYQLNAPTHMPIPPDVWHHLTVSYNGDRVNVTLNDELVVNSELNQHRTELGSVGLITLTGESKFKGITFLPQ
ncbi:LCCL domain-containing protein [Plasmodium knowlesi strain H]|uniref:LCCL domain-containing protein n=3 Tax=Plasmodium knowlesi TaxID=5850 RepID=A0A5K1U9A5_PLAKH|nr:LCCL domain-containing protein [Plasmodium knowlesi strain H]OTN67387.1 LCCL domain-containing protein [Plasmodium knowlesi]CAA9987305.1 LCCL domain-containing protein [Plasmodium knowlesi strain H]SBO23419.1 LCCL domain-containing protein [Plasmodium knowlesi strain H]SBO24689.1 LCCL domain-containing protein [Plasmodium knowlesi strain H]VVS76779.1 LCCL domain-containing protein [Plasmodium knowlesi strain H]|eukprot:XP_002258309.1 hypothetical protein, conserved in Plasmodium species [Plasmodium knowlesi strain H]